MKRAVSALLAATAMLFALTVVAHADSATLTFRNSSPYVVYMRVFSDDRTRVWPAPKGSRVTYWLLDDDAKHDIKIKCTGAEKVCYGGGYDLVDKVHHWGVGFQGGKSCSHCCIHCGQSHSWNLTDGSPCANVDPGLGCQSTP